MLVIAPPIPCFGCYLVLTSFFSVYKNIPFFIKYIFLNRFINSSIRSTYIQISFMLLFKSNYIFIVDLYLILAIRFSMRAFLLNNVDIWLFSLLLIGLIFSAIKNNEQSFYRCLLYRYFLCLHFFIDNCQKLKVINLLYFLLGAFPAAQMTATNLSILIEHSKCRFNCYISFEKHSSPFKFP